MGFMAKNKFHEGAGPSQRQLRVGETVRRALSDVLARGDVHDTDLNRLSITVGEVRISPDLRFQLDRTFDRMDDTRRMLNQDVVRRDADAPDDDAADSAPDQ